MEKTLQFVYTTDGLKANNEETQLFLDQYRFHAILELKATDVAFGNTQQLRKFNKMIQDAHENLPEGIPIMSREEFKKWILVLSGHCEATVIENNKGELFTVFTAKSTRIESMTAIEFTRLFHRVLNTILNYFDYEEEFEKRFI